MTLDKYSYNSKERYKHTKVEVNLFYHIQREKNMVVSTDVEI